MTQGNFRKIFPGIFYYNFFQIFQILFLTKAEKTSRNIFQRKNYKCIKLKEVVGRGN